MEGDDAVLERLLRTRRSIRRFGPEPVARSIVERLVEAATLAPSASNRQPWRFVAVTDGPRIAALANQVRAAASLVASALEPDVAPTFRAYAEDFARFEGAPVVLAVAWRRLETLSSLLGDARLDPGPLEDVRTLEETSGCMSASLGVMNLLTMAHALGLGAAAMTGPLLARHEIAGALGIDPPWALLCLIALGHPAETPGAPGRKPVARVLRWMDEPKTPLPGPETT